MVTLDFCTSIVVWIDVMAMWFYPYILWHCEGMESDDHIYTHMCFERERFTLHLRHRLSSYVNPTHGCRDKLQCVICIYIGESCGEDATLMDTNIHFFFVQRLVKHANVKWFLFYSIFSWLKFWTIYCTQGAQLRVEAGRHIYNIKHNNDHVAIRVCYGL